MIVQRIILTCIVCRRSSLRLVCLQWSTTEVQRNRRAMAHCCCRDQIWRQRQRTDRKQSRTRTTSGRKERTVSGLGGRRRCLHYGLCMSAKQQLLIDIRCRSQWRHQSRRTGCNITVAGVGRLVRRNRWRWSDDVIIDRPRPLGATLDQETTWHSDTTSTTLCQARRLYANDRQRLLNREHCLHCIGYMLMKNCQI